MPRKQRLGLPPENESRRDAAAESGSASPNRGVGQAGYFPAGALAPMAGSLALSFSSRIWITASDLSFAM
jgi:hypothetical protein